MVDIFISYSRSDRYKAENLAHILGQQGWDVWWDRAIPLGRTFDKAIEEALDSAKCVLVLWSITSVSSDWVRIEASEGASRGILLPVIIEETKIPLEFRRLQAANLVGWQGGLSDPELEGLLRSIAKVIGKPLRDELSGYDHSKSQSNTTSTVKADFGKAILELVDHSKTEFQRLTTVKTKSSEGGYAWYDPSSVFSLPESFGNSLYFHPQAGGMWIFGADLARGMSQEKAESLFNKRAMDIESTLPSQWKIESKTYSGLWKLVAVNNISKLEITLSLYMHSSEECNISFLFVQYISGKQ